MAPVVGGINHAGGFGAFVDVAVGGDANAVDGAVAARLAGIAAGVVGGVGLGQQRLLVDHGEVLAAVGGPVGLRPLAPPQMVPSARGSTGT